MFDSFHMFGRSESFFAGFVEREPFTDLFCQIFFFVSLARTLFILFASYCSHGKFWRSVFPGLCNKIIRLSFSINLIR